jgi:hypothetical protein
MKAEEKRTPEKAVADYLRRGRSLSQIRAIAVARGDVALMTYLARLMAEAADVFG